MKPAEAAANATGPRSQSSSLANNYFWQGTRPMPAHARQCLPVPASARQSRALHHFLLQPSLFRLSILISTSFITTPTSSLPCEQISTLHRLLLFFLHVINSVHCRCRSVSSSPLWTSTASVTNFDFSFSFSGSSVLLFSVFYSLSASSCAAA